MGDNTVTNLIAYLEEHGKDKTWQQLADQFGYGNKKIPEGIWRRHREGKALGKQYKPLPRNMEGLADKVSRRGEHQKAETANYIAALEEEIIRITDRESDRNTGTEKFTIQSSRPLQPREIDELVGADGISVCVDRVWHKSHKNGSWTYSIQTVNKIKNFYTNEELDARLREIFNSMESDATEMPVHLEVNSDKALFVYIGDDHAGSLITSSLFNKEYSGKTYLQRLLQLADEIKSLGQVFSEMYIIRMGDELDGFNGKTTRYDHDLGSASNKEQFDIYTTANKLFYGEVFCSGKAEHYTVINLNNSNHSGNGYAYIANKALEFWMEGKFQNVKVKHQNKFIDIYTFGSHIIGLCHGKDEKFMKAPMPLNLDHKTDLWLMDFYKLNIRDGAFVSTVKADIHKYNVNYGKSGRYVNVPSISSGSQWIELNFGDSKPGCLMEIYTADSQNIVSIPVWFE